MVIRGVVFDLDDTLFWERDYVSSGFAHVARLASRSEGEARVLANWLERAFEAGSRGDTFDRLLAAYPKLGERVSVATLVDAYRAHEPTIALARGVEDVLDRLHARGLKLGVLSDGPLASQAAKVRRLRLERWCEPIVLTASLGPAFVKPSDLGFRFIAERWTITALEMAYVGDNPAKDFVAPRSLGWLTVRLRHGAQLRFAVEPPSAEYEANVQIGELAEIWAHLALPESSRLAGRAFPTTAR